MRPLWAAVLVGVAALAATGYAVWRWQGGGAGAGAGADEAEASTGACTQNPVAFIGHVQVDRHGDQLAPSVELIDADGKCTTPEGVTVSALVEAVFRDDGSKEIVCVAKDTFGGSGMPFTPVSIRSRRTGEVEKSAVADLEVAALAPLGGLKGERCRAPARQTFGARVTVKVDQGGRLVTDTVPVSLPEH